MDTPNEPKKRGRKPGTPKTPGSGRVKGRPPQVPENIRAVCREVLGLDNLVIRKKLRQWLEAGDGLGSTTFRHVLQMGYGIPKHSMESGDQRRQTLVFLGIKPWERRTEMDDISDRLIAEKAAEEKTLALEKAKPVVLDVKADKGDSEAELELVEPPPEQPPSPEDFGGRR